MAMFPGDIFPYTSPGLPGDLWDWLRLLMEETILPSRQGISRPFGSVAPMTVACAERLLSPRAHQRLQERALDEHQYRSWIVRDVEREFFQRFGCTPTTVLTVADAASAALPNGVSFTVHFPPTELLSTVENVFLYTLLRTSDLTQAQACPALAQLLALPEDKREIMVSLLEDEVPFQAALQGALLL